jgi:hypothetical protein
VDECGDRSNSLGLIKNKPLTTETHRRRGKTKRKFKMNKRNK